MIDTAQAANLFMDIVFQCVYVDLFKEICTTGLPEGMPGSDDPANLASWYQKLNGEQRAFLEEVVQQTIIHTATCFLSILDNKVGFPLQGQISQFAVNLETYENWDAVSRNIAQESVRLNMFWLPDCAELEILFLERLNDAGVSLTN